MCCSRCDVEAGVEVDVAVTSIEADTDSKAVKTIFVHHTLPYLSSQPGRILGHLYGKEIGWFRADQPVDY